MSLKSMVGISLLILTVPAASSAWQPPPAARQPGVLPPPRSVPAPEQSVPGVPREYPPGAPSTGPVYQVPQAQGYSNGSQPGYPQYPYPPYHNPYFGGYSARNFVSNAIDWIITLPSNVFDRFSNYLDGTIFPRAPATHGKSSVQPGTSAPSRPRRMPSDEPLPPASVYSPREQ
jgi:hypothetical protein